MTSAEKVAELRQAVTAGIAGLDRESEVAEQVFSWVGLWHLVPGFIRRKITAAIVEQVPLELLEDAAALDDILGLLAGLALELRSDEYEVIPNYTDRALDGISFKPEQVELYRERAADLLEQVRSLGA